MSSDAVDRMYEEDLQAEAALRLYVNGSLKRVEPNTAVGRDVMEKAAMLASLKSDDVQVRTAGRDGSGDGLVSRRRPSQSPLRDANAGGRSAVRSRASAGASVPVSQPVQGGAGGSSGTRVASGNGLVQLGNARSHGRNQGDPAKRALALSCCAPERYAGPSGVRWRHRWDCPTAKGQVYDGPVADLGRIRLNRRHQIETRRTGLDDAIRAHPASYLSAQAHDRWHPGQGEDCVECAERGD